MRLRQPLGQVKIVTGGGVTLNRGDGGIPAATDGSRAIELQQGNPLTLDFPLATAMKLCAFKADDLLDVGNGITAADEMAVVKGEVGANRPSG